MQHFAIFFTNKIESALYTTFEYSVKFDVMSSRVVNLFLFSFFNFDRTKKKRIEFMQMHSFIELFYQINWSLYWLAT